MSLPEIEPTQITAGDTVAWTRLAADCINPAGDECPATDYTLTYALVKDGKAIELTADASDDDFAVAITPDVSAEWDPGLYKWQAYLTATVGGARYTPAARPSGIIEILPNFAALSTGYDGRSHVERTIDALQATIEKRATKDQAGVMVAGEMIGKMPIHRLLELYNQYQAIYAASQAAADIENGMYNPANIYIRFTDD